MSTPTPFRGLRSRLLARLAPALMLALPVAGSGQTAYVLDAAAIGLTEPVHLPTTAYPAGGAAAPLPLGTWGAVGAPGAPPPAGGHAIAFNVVYSSDGVMIAQDLHPRYPGFFCPGGAICFAPVAAPVLLGGGPVTGLAYDAVNGFLWACDAVSVQPFLPPPILGLPGPLVPAGPPFPIPAPAPLSGLGYEPGTNTLWACDVLGNVFNFTILGAVLGVVPPALPPIGFMTGLAVNRTNGQPGDAAPPPCSTQLPGYHVVVTDGFNVYDALNPAAPPIPRNLPGPAYGLAYGNDPQVSPAAPPLNTAQIFTNQPANIGVPPPPAAQLAVRIFDPNPAAPPIVNPVLFLIPCPMGLAFTPRGGLLPAPGGGGGPVPLGPGVPDPGFPGAFIVPLAPPALAGMQITTQWMFFDPTAGMPSMTDMLTITSGRP